MSRRAVLATVASLVLVLCLGTAHGVNNGGDWGVPSFPVGVNLPHFGRKDGAYGAHTSVDFEGSSTGIFLDLWKVKPPVCRATCQLPHTQPDLRLNA